MAETMLLALEQSFLDTSLGVELEIETIHKFDLLAEKHGFVVVT
jgi:predicted amino acid dehydrogenase